MFYINVKPFVYAIAGLITVWVYANQSIAVAEEASNTAFFLEVRERVESLKNFNDKFYGTAPKAGQSSDTYLLSRIDFGLTHQVNEYLAAKFSLQDARVFGWGFKDEDWRNREFGNMINNPQADQMELGESWLEFKHDQISLKLGRQPIAFGNKRVFGPGAWKNSGKWRWDAAKFTYTIEKNWVSAFYGRAMLHDPDEFSLSHHHGFRATGGYGHFELNDSLTIEPMLVTKENNISLDYAKKDIYYYGTRLLFKKAGWLVDATYLQQSGDTTKLTGGETKADAQGANLDIQYRINPKWMLSTTYGFASGDDKSTSNNEQFDGVYGAFDKYYGRMNLMAWSNLHDYGLLVNYRPTRDIELEMEYHQFYADDVKDTWLAYKNGLTASSKHYGNEIDLVATYNFDKRLEFMAGLGVFMPGDAIQQAVAAKQANLTDTTAYSGFFQVIYHLDF
jgi:hypothetical protein